MVDNQDQHSQDEEQSMPQETHQPDASSASEEIQTSAARPKQVMVTDEELRNLRREANEYKDKYLRLLAEMENTRKRMQKERQEMTQYAIENVIVEFLKPLDQLENALRHADQASNEVKNWAMGFQMILTQFKDVLAQHKVAAINSKGQPFDPYSHEAVEMVETTDYPPGTVIEEYVKGYRIGERVIRPARVKVSKTQQAAQNEPFEQD